MARVVIYDDDPTDVNIRYSELIPEHDLSIFLLDNAALKKDDHERIFQMGMEDLPEAGFRRDQIHRGLPDNHPEADVYFVDGLYGKCFDILSQLPRERSYIVTGSIDVVKQAQREKLNIVWNNGDISDIVKRHATPE
jgi:hypothetical protein